MTRQIAENKTRNNRKRKVIDEILDIEKKNKIMENDIKVLYKSAEKYADKADNTGRFRLLPSQTV
jgi:hypothetical protein